MRELFARAADGWGYARLARWAKARAPTKRQGDGSDRPFRWAPSSVKSLLWGKTVQALLVDEATIRRMAAARAIDFPRARRSTLALAPPRRRPLHLRQATIGALLRRVEIPYPLLYLPGPRRLAVPCAPRRRAGGRVCGAPSATERRSSHPGTIGAHRKRGTAQGPGNRAARASEEARPAATARVRARRGRWLLRQGSARPARAYRRGAESRGATDR